jgi:hypothetical protein
MELSSRNKQDDILEDYLLETDHARSNRLVVELVCEHARPIFEKVINSKLGVHRAPHDGIREQEDTEDVCNDVIVQLLKRLRALKTSTSGVRLANFSAYVAVTAYNACNRYLREKYPEWYRLKSKLRYVLNRRASFALWQIESQWICGLADWRLQQRRPISREQLRQVCHHAAFQLDSVVSNDWKRIDHDSLLAAVFRETQSPAEFDDLVTVVSEICGIRDHRPPVNARPEPANDRNQPVDISASHATRIEHRLYLERLWQEICLLPLRQRAALLLNLRDSEGSELVTMIAYLRIATLSQIAQVLEVSAETFAEIWSSLPIDDASIARYLGVTRQQVINLRLSGRRRLARRMK